MLPTEKVKTGDLVKVYRPSIGNLNYSGKVGTVKTFVSRPGAGTFVLVELETGEDVEFKSWELIVMS